MDVRNKFKGARLLGVALMLLALPGALQAAKENLTTTIVRTLASEESSYGGCMAQLAVAVNEATSLANCTSRWVTFSCTGEHTSKAAAQRMYDSALLAFVTGRSALLAVDDERTHGSYCFVSRIDVLGS